MKITVDMVMLWACQSWHRKAVESLFEGRESLTVREALDLPIGAADKMWQAVHILDHDHIERALTRSVDRVVSELVTECGVSEVDKWVAAWLDGTDRTAKSARHASYYTRWGYLLNCIWAAEELAAWLEMAPEDLAHGEAWSCVKCLSCSAGYEGENMLESILEDFKATIEEN